MTMGAAAMRLTWPGAAGALLLLAGVGGCTGGKMPTRASLPRLASETSGRPVPTSPHETSVIVAGTPTGVFTQVAQGALGCWFGANGSLKASHIYRAGAEPPAKGGDAEIVIHERDVSLR